MTHKQSQARQTLLEEPGVVKKNVTLPPSSALHIPSGILKDLHRLGRPWANNTSQWILHQKVPENMLRQDTPSALWFWAEIP